MLGIITTLSAIKPQPVDSQVEEELSHSYLINTDCIVEMAVEGTTDSKILYQFNVYSDRKGPFTFTVNETNAAIQTLADATLNSPKISLSVYEDANTFAVAAAVTPVTWVFNVSDIIWGEDDSTGSYSRIWVREGGNKLVPYIVGNTIQDLEDIADTGTTSA